MNQLEAIDEVDQPVGYALRRAATALRAAMRRALRRLDLTMVEYTCLELLGQRPGLSAAEMARTGLVSRQAIDPVLLDLEDRGLLTRSRGVDSGRALPNRLTAPGQRALRAASSAVADLERQMLSPLGPAEQDRLRASLAACADALANPADQPERIRSS